MIMQIRLGCASGRFLQAFLLFVGISLMSSGALAGTYVILEESFESPVVTNSTRVSVEGWDRQHNYTELFTENASPYVQTPFGSQYYIVWQDPNKRLVTTNITDRLQPGATYTLTFNTGNMRPSTGIPTIVTCRAEIMAGTNVIASADIITDQADFSTVGSVSVTTDGSHPNLGELLGIRFQHVAGDWQERVLIDNVRLVADESASEYKHTLHIGK